MNTVQYGFDICIPDKGICKQPSNTRRRRLIYRTKAPTIGLLHLKSQNIHKGSGRFCLIVRAHHLDTQRAVPVLHGLHDFERRYPQETMYARRDSAALSMTVALVSAVVAAQIALASGQNLIPEFKAPLQDGDKGNVSMASIRMQSVVNKASDTLDARVLNRTSDYEVGNALIWGAWISANNQLVKNLSKHSTSRCQTSILRSAWRGHRSQSSSRQMRGR